ncbi:MAG: GMC family oxidoreductase N-terminal domain-containing protein [Cyanobacteria bacterium P01_A01_bin.84]
MARLSSPIENIKSHYTVIVIGSGYGGSIAASRLSRAGAKVCILERGKEFQAGEFPDTPQEALQEMQINLPKKHVGSHTGLYDFHVNEDINVFVGCGLGGTSLINANVSLRAEDSVFQDESWPQELRRDVNILLADGYKRAEEMLKPTPYPDTFPNLAKLEALEKSAKYLNEDFYRPPINVNFKAGTNHVGVEQKPCNLCGDCVTGCNQTAKNTTLMNYLPDAKNHGAEIYTRVSVSHIEKQESNQRRERWLVHFQVLGSGQNKFDAPTMFISADMVILAAGTLGSTKILLRSAAKGLNVSKKLGHRFSGNGDVLAFGYNNDQKINGIGYGSRLPQDMEPVGPCITGIIDIRNQPRLNNSMVIEEGSIPGAISSVLPKTFATAAKLFGEDTDNGITDLVKEKTRELKSLVRGSYKGAVQNTQTFLVMSHDDAGGKMYLENNELRIDWKGIGQQTHFQRIDDRIEQATRSLGGTKIPNPMWNKLFQKDLVTVHPLGGCPMGDDAQKGVVNHKGQVFSGIQGTDTYQGLYVCDGSVIPRSLGVNPLLTISAIAERCCFLIAEDNGWTINYNLPSRPMHATIRTPSQPKPGIQFTETMRGYVSLLEKYDYELAAKQGKKDNSPLKFTLTITSNNLEEMLSNPKHEANIIGTVSAPTLSSDPLTVTDGDFHLFVKNPDDEVNTRRMVYSLKMRAEDGKTYNLEGFKLVHDDRGIDIWSDTTTLYISIYECDTHKRELVGKGILKILPKDFLRQMTTIQVTNAENTRQRLKLTARFGHFFAGELFDTYGEIFAKPTIFNPDAPPRKQRQLRVWAPQVYYFNTSDNVRLRLTRYQGGTKGPVMLVHGFGVSSRIFSTDTIETNLLEYLFAHGYDVWLLDYRASVELAISNVQFTGDDVAIKDYPPAIDTVKHITGADTVQMVVHCFGSTTFFMSMLAGLKGVRCAVASQIATHMRVPLMTRLKSELYLPTVLKSLGIDTFTADVEKNAHWLNDLLDNALKLYPVSAGEGDISPVSRRISFLYGQLYELDQLNNGTYDNLHELFGVGNISGFEHLAMLVRKGHLVTADGNDKYMGNLDRLAIPMTFIHGAENNCWLPESTEITYNVLREKNGHKLYKRHVIPNYGHIDCIFGKNAVNDVYPLILQQLEDTLD